MADLKFLVLAFLAILALDLPLPAMEGDVVQESILSFDKKLRLELVGSNGGNAHTLFLAEVNHPERRTIVFSDLNLAIHSAAISKDNHYIACFWGGASYGVEPLLFIRGRHGTYTQRKGETWLLAFGKAQATRMIPPGAEPAHLYCKSRGFSAKSDALVFDLSGDYTNGDGQVPFGPIGFRYLMDERTFEVMPQVTNFIPAARRR